MRKILLLITLLTTFCANAQFDVSDLQREMKVSDAKMTDFIKKNYSRFSKSQGVKLCLPLLEDGDEYAINALYTTILFALLNETANTGSDRAMLKKNLYKKKIIPHYSAAITYCQIKSTR